MVFTLLKRERMNTVNTMNTVNAMNIVNAFSGVL